MVVGKVISHYRVLEKIGEGGLGVVYAAEDTILARRVALKFLTRTERSEARHQILEEARSAASIDHPYACKVFEAGDWEGKSFIVMEYLEGETLQQRLRSGPLPVAEALRIAGEIAEALAEAHDKHIVHCDLKPANVMITRSGHIKLMDFGLARIMRVARADAEDLTAPIMPSDRPLLGTPAYMAPEQARGEEVDSRADVFAFGITVFEMLSGLNPFRRSSQELTLAAVFQDTAPIEKLPPNAPPGAGPFLERALAKRPAERPGTGRDLLTELMRLQAPAVAPGDRADQSAAAVSAIAVLPFTDFSPEKNQEYLCHGLAEELIGALGGLGPLRIASRTAAFRYKDADLDMQEIGRSLKVESVLEGSVQKIGDRVRIVVKLVDVANGYSIWSERYDRKLDDIFQLQDEIALRVIEKLRVTLAGAAVKPVLAGPRNARAYEHYLKGRHFWNKRTPENLKQSVERFQQAIAEDADYALAYAGLADAHVTLCLYGAVEPVEAMPLGRNAAEKALRLYPELAEALTARAAVRSMFDWDWETAGREFEAAIGSNPNYAQARQWYAMNCLAPRREFEKAHAELKMAAELDPVSLAIAASFGILKFFERDYAGALTQLRAVLQMDEGFFLAHYFLGQIHVEMKRYDDAIRQLERTAELNGRAPESVAVLGYIHAKAGHKADALHALEELKTQSASRYVSPVLFAHLQAGLKDNDAAVASLEEAFRKRSTDLMWLPVLPAFDRLRAVPRVGGLLAKMGLPTGSPVTA